MNDDEAKNYWEFQIPPIVKRVDDNKEYWEFIRQTRNDRHFNYAFIDQSEITVEQQERYMTENGHNFFVCIIDNKPVGFIGYVDNDVKIYVNLEHLRKGIGTLLMKETKHLYPEAKVKVRYENQEALAFFISLGYKIECFLLKEKN